MFTPMMASAAGYASTAYFYNLGRFKFDAEQRQDCIYQIQNMRLDNYILVGALIVTAVMNFIFVGYPAFPLEPRWLLLLWNNCVFACITFGLVSVWLALHGSIAQRSARVKILTQAVRPPVPSLKDIQEAMRAQEIGFSAELEKDRRETPPQTLVFNHKQVYPNLHTPSTGTVNPVVRQESFEGGGARRYFEPPAFLVPTTDSSDAAGVGAVPKPTGPPPGRTVPQVTRRPRAKGKPKNAEAVDWLSDAPYAGEEVLQHLETADNGGPGRSAVMYSHFWMLRRVQRGYACFDAYARISLVVAAQQMLLVCAYYSLGHFMSKMDHWPTRAQNPGAAWLSLAASVFASTTLFKLDLFCGWRSRYLMMITLIAPALCAGLAIHLAAARTNHGKGGIRPCDQVIPAWLPWFLAIVACVGHMCWILLIQRMSAPLVENSSSGLPLSFRSTIYLDIFGWHSRHFSAAAVLNAVDCAHHWENAEKMLYDSMDKQRGDNKYLVMAHQDAKQISKTLTHMTQPEVACHLTREEQDDLQQLKYTVEDYVHELESQMSLPVREDAKSGAPAWLQCTCVEGASEEVFWVDCRSAQVSWMIPEEGQIVDLVRLRRSLEELEARQALSPKTFQAAAVAADALPFELMPENPDQEVSSSQLPWKCIRLSCYAQLGAWIFTVLVILFDRKYYDSAVAPREMYDHVALWKVQTDWPHEYFRPSALACDAQRRLMLGDQFAIYAADLELIGESAETSVEVFKGQEESRSKPVKFLRTVTLEPMMLTSELDRSWRSFGFLPKKGKLLLLTQDGTEVEEYSLHRHHYVKTWTLSNSLPHKKLEAIQAVEGEEAEDCAKDSSGFVNAGWLLYAATDSGQVVTLCPTFRNELHPLLMVISLRRRKAAKDLVEVVDSHTGTTKASSSRIIAVVRDPSTGWFWLLNTNTEGIAEVTAWDLEKEKNMEVGRWALPSGRWWVPGMCHLGHNQGFLLAAAADTNRVGQAGRDHTGRWVRFNVDVDNVV
ncbi:Copia protein [Durusdinium trenchii]|uniref:Copia protein n=1 Tax=Durusdinium trenchii TaxID=1381693 RepID=A0ABP0PXQ8_9DINO